MDQNRVCENQAAERRKSFIGVVMTIIYAVIYGGFVFLSIFFPSMMGVQTILGMNLAVTYGLGLIVVAIILAIIYNQLVRSPKKRQMDKNSLELEQSEREQ